MSEVLIIATGVHVDGDVAYKTYNLYSKGKGQYVPKWLFTKQPFSNTIILKTTVSINGRFVTPPISSSHPVPENAGSQNHRSQKGVNILYAFI